LNYKISFKKSVFKDLNRLSKPEAKKILDKIESDLPSTASECPMLKGKFKGLRKFRVGTYRIIFAILEDQILILRIDHRKEVYKK